MDLGSKSQKPSPYTARPDPCHRCQLTTCFSLHAYSASNCPYNICADCSDLEALDAQITEFQDILRDLAEKRHEIKRRINRRHDLFTSRLPLKVISYIFAFIVDAASDSPPYTSNFRIHKWNPTLILGAVCRRWRDITLGTPQLWANVRINPQKDRRFPEMTSEWLSRSCELPLSLAIHANGSPGTYNDDLSRPYSKVFQLIRSQAHRWKDLTLKVPTSMLRSLLTGLGDKFSVDSLVVHSFGIDTPVGMDQIDTEYFLAPKRLDIFGVPLPHIPVQWHRLTYLTTNQVGFDCIIHIFHHAHNLSECIIHFILEETGQYPIPSSPVINVSVKQLDISNMESDQNYALLLRHLTLPSLKIFRCTATNVDDQRDIDALCAFIDRSQPLLHEFSLYYLDPRSDHFSPFRCDWFQRLPFLTSLDLDISWDDGRCIEEYIQGLGAHKTPMAFPCLQELKIRANKINPRLWDGLAAIFPDSEEIKSEAPPVVSRPLKTVTILFNTFSSGRNKIMGKATYSRLCAIRESGVALEVYAEDEIDILGPGVELTFCESDEDYDYERWEGFPIEMNINAVRGQGQGQVFR